MVGAYIVDSHCSINPGEPVTQAHSDSNSDFIADHRLTFQEVLDEMLDGGLISQNKAEELRFMPRTGASHPLVILAERQLEGLDGGVLTLGALCRWLAGRVGLPYRRIDPLKIDVDSVTRVVSPAYAARFNILPLEVNQDEVVFATAEPYEREWERELAHVLQRKITRVFANPLDVDRYQREFFSIGRSIREVSKRNKLELLSGFGNVEALVELGRAGKLDANDSHIVTIVDWLLQYAYHQRASDIHIEPRREQGNIRFRIDGVLHTVYQMPLPILIAVTSRVKALGRMDVVEKRRAQDGRVKTKTPEGQEVELRLSTMPTAFGEKLVMRIFDPQVLLHSLSELGFTKGDAKHWREMTAQTHGIVLVTGPTGSGKTTTLYSTLKALADPGLNLCTIEDPIEMVVPSFNQMQVNHDIGLDFSSGVRTLMRQDPDIVMVGEIRDLETAEMAIQASLTGHLVLSTLHTNDAPTAITRLMDLGVPPYLINATLNGVVAQRLVRTLCPHCKKEGKVEPAAWDALTKPWSVPQPQKVSLPVGCGKCRHTGYLGRVGLYEILRLGPELKALVKPDGGDDPIRRAALKLGMEPLRISGARKVINGVTSIEEVLRVVPAVSGI
jgi:general secretion pathway protein E